MQYQSLPFFYAQSETSYVKVFLERAHTGGVILNQLMMFESKYRLLIRELEKSNCPGIYSIT